MIGAGENSAGTLGIVMLCHTALDRAQQVARFWAAGGCPVVIHLDRSVPGDAAKELRAALADLGAVRVIQRHRCPWGRWGIVAATLDATADLLAANPGVRHVALTSGACLPLRPVAEMMAWLAERADTDFIESVSVHDVSWTVGGLSVERFTRWFPFDWRRQRWLFDAAVEVQRALGLRREVPRPLDPHLGSQWWCLTRVTLEAILNDPKRRRYERYFRHVWIPDEAYFQTLARRHARRIESRSLTLAKFDRNGRPHLFYDDHLQLLRRSDCFIARKIWPQAERLYDFFLTDKVAQGRPVNPQPERIARHFARAERQRLEGRAGLYMQSRFPAETVTRDKTAGPYAMLCGFSALYPGIAKWLSDAAGTRVHGHLYARERVEFAGGARVWNGALSDSAALRDYNPRMFLTNLIWNTRGERQVFQYAPQDATDPGLETFIATDANAHVAIISGGWVLGFVGRDPADPEVRRELAALQKSELALLERLRGPEARAQVRIWTLAEYLEAPDDNLALMLAHIAPGAEASKPPERVALDWVGPFVASTRNAGLPLVTLGDYPTGAAPASGGWRAPE